MKLVSKKDMIFVAVLFLFVIIFSLFTSGDAVDVDFTSDVVSIRSSGFEFDIAYTDVEKLELTALPDLGTMEKGADTNAVKSGNWNNAIWGDYHLCVIPSNTDCIVVTLKDGRTVVFNYKEAENTAGVYEIFQGYLDELAA